MMDITNATNYQNISSFQLMEQCQIINWNFSIWNFLFRSSYWYTELDSLKQAIVPFEKVLQKQIKAIGYSVYTGDGKIFTSRTAAQDQDFNLNLVEVIPVGDGTRWWPADVKLIIYPYFVTQ